MAKNNDFELETILEKATEYYSVISLDQTYEELTSIVLRVNIKNLRDAVKITKNHYETEASGNVTLKTVKKIASTGVNRISVGSITHSAPAVDFKLEI